MAMAVIVTTASSMSVSMTSAAAEHLSDLDEVEDQADDCDDKHSPAQHLGLFTESGIGFLHQEDGHHPDRYDGYQGSNYLGSVPAVSQSGGKFLSAEADGGHCDSVSYQVGGQV